MKDTNKPNLSSQRPGYQSLFFKLFVVLLGTVLLAYLAFGGFYRSFWNVSARMESHRNLIHYSDLLSSEIGLPPDTLVAERLSKELGQAIGIKSSTLNWRSKNFSDYVWNHTAPNLPDSIQFSVHEGRLWMVLDKGDCVFIFGSYRRPFSEGLNRDWIALLVVLALAWFLAWRILHRMLQPLRQLETGVSAVESGNLDVRLSEKGRDELSALARSFNAMTKSLKERLLARDQLLLDVSHELRSPLTRMRVALEMAPPGAAVESLREEVEALGKMVSEILETERLNSQAGALKREPTDLAKMVTEKVAKFAGQSPGISWDSVELPPVPLDAERIRLVLRNIIDNALKYGKTASQPIEISLWKETGSAVLEVRDFGPGIPEEDQRLVFEPFYRVDRSRSRTSGYGLGLSLCKRIVEAHGGTISIHSRSGRGTRVTIKLPLK